MRRCKVGRAGGIRTLFCSLFLAGGLLGYSAANHTAAAQPTDNRLPVPTERQQQPVKAKFETLFRQKYRTVTPSTVQQFVFLLGNNYGNDQNHPVTRYVALSMAADLGARDWAPLASFGAAGSLVASYRVNEAKLFAELGRKMLAVPDGYGIVHVNTPQFVYSTLYARMMQEIPLADTAGDYPYALQMAQIAVRCARLLHSPTNLQTAKLQLQKQQILAALWSQAKLDIAALKLKPSDPTLNLHVGLFTWLAEKKRRDGLKLLEASGIADAARVAKITRNGPADIAAWLRYFELLQKLAVRAKQPVYSQLVTRKITKWFNNQAAGVMPAFFATLQTASYGDANHLLTKAITQARSVGDSALAAWAQKWHLQQRTMLALHRRYNAAMRQVQNNPDFHLGNALIGQYLCLMKGQWKVGCDYLLKSGDPRLIAAGRGEQAALKHRAAVTKANAAVQSARQALQSAPKPKPGKAVDPGLALAVQAAKQALTKAKAAAAAAYIAAATNWWHAAAGLKPPLQYLAEARAVHWYRRGYKPLSEAPAAIIYRVKRFEASGE